jgi:hypothetical protein
MTFASVTLLERTAGPHPLHGSTRIWSETNCYVDLFVELLAGLGFDPVPSLAFSLGIEFEGDQWSFIKHPIDDLRTVYGIDVSELALWRPLRDHLVEQLTLDRVVVVEVDSFHLPDTHATTYRTEHVKSSIAVTAIDIEQSCLSYFHGAGHFSVGGDDFAGLLRLDDPERFSVDVLPPYAEIVKRDRGFVLETSEAQQVAFHLARQHLSRRRNAEDCARRFEQRLVADAAEFLRDLPTFHAYAFATVRQLGAASELASDLFGFLDEPTVAELFLQSAQSCKSLQFKLARAAVGRQIDLAAVARETTDCWLAAMGAAKDAVVSDPGQGS